MDSSELIFRKRYRIHCIDSQHLCAVESHKGELPFLSGALFVFMSTTEVKPTNAVVARKGQQSTHIVQRLHHLGGRLEILSTDSGTTVVATVPIKQASK